MRKNVKGAKGAKKRSHGRGKKRTLTRQDRELYVLELARARVAFQLGAALSESGMTQRGLAAKLGVSEARISQALDADEANLTLKSLSRLVTALDCELDVVIRRRVQLPRALTEHVHEGSQLLLAAPTNAAFLEAKDATVWNSVDLLKTLSYEPPVDWNRDAANEAQYAAA